MPRPRVRPENRKRCATACVQCRISKKRCDSRHPCQKCVAKGEAEHCVFPVEHSSVDNRRALVVSHTVGCPLYTLSSIKQRSILLKCSLDERVFLGNTAAMSFLKFLQQIWRTYVESNSFTEDRGTDQMLEMEMPPPMTASKREVDENEKRYFVECYLHASSGILDLFTERDIERFLSPNAEIRSPDSIVDPETNNDICLDLMIAIGAQCQARGDLDHYLGELYFRRAQKSAFAGMLQAPTVNLARSFVLMAFYTLGACTRNSALMYIGVASNISVILGLHSPENYQYLPIEKREARLQTGKSVRVLDLICNTILGRPGSTPVLRNEREYLDGEICPNYATLCATYEIVSVLQLVVNDTKEKEGIPINKAEEYLLQLRKWSSGLPSHLRRQSLEGPSSQRSLETRRATVGKIHLACIYYYGVIQVTRQFLVDQVVPHVCGQTADDRADNRTSKLATMCREAALLMAQMCEDAEKAGALLGNMCILKAWLFSSGLVLGFSLLRPHELMEDTRRAFQATSRILGHFGVTSPQANQYHCILSRFAEAINRHERKPQSERARLEDTRVEKILSFDMADHQHSTLTDFSSPGVDSEAHSHDHPAGIFENEDFFQQWDWSPPTGNNEILRMFIDPCLDNLMNLPSADMIWDS
ncbi:hypothetical protein BGW36DRAFT_415426 [Talaromyces proteolyticus]|uniref:Zn(2)-C6 fungal-type domain-containing protein n=1 Tax=Talaromyces proteolyticus TaxID=1131652 RepID=A0AAD4Q2F4_9EURO|nr:uncharacterized protein BGW36DRAFT_415426 [Talaromyces proteolyticus]KAH8700326.1 hypothetical protein BGW36DRAFT_415426 [Talaromyces proteolyticus]